MPQNGSHILKYMSNNLFIISHRGNLNGRVPEKENHPDQILFVSSYFDVEIDVWYMNGKYVLGHDYPQYEIPEYFLQRNLWCHAKNFEALDRMLHAAIHCFWHEEDKLTLTSKSIPWCYPGFYVKNGITVIKSDSFQTDISILGICTDYPIKLKPIACSSACGIMTE